MRTGIRSSQNTKAAILDFAAFEIRASDIRHVLVSQPWIRSDSFLDFPPPVTGNRF
jgi:hypothetical protein